MVLDLISAFFFVKVAVALAASGWAGWVDFKTTDVPDLAPWIMGVSGIVLNGALSLLTNDWSHLMWSVGVGLGFAAFGFGYYFARGWGGGDAKLLAGMGFLVPLAPTSSTLPYPLAFVINLFVVGAVYSIIFSFYAASKKPKVWGLFKRDIRKKESLAYIFGAPILAALFPIALALYVNAPLADSYSLSLITAALVFATMFWWRFAKIVESKVFLYQLPVSKLKEGDVIAKDVKVGKKIIRAGLIEGLTRSEVVQIRKYQKYVWVKEGVRFAPVFPLTLIATLLGFSLF